LSCLIRATGWANAPRWGGRLRCWLGGGGGRVAKFLEKQRKNRENKQIRQQNKKKKGKKNKDSKKNVSSNVRIDGFENTDANL
jgi:hypothetical protein